MMKNGIYFIVIAFLVAEFRVVTAIKSSCLIVIKQVVGTSMILDKVYFF